MNPDRKGGLTVDALMQTGLIVSAAIPVLAFAALGFALFGLEDKTILAFVILSCAIAVLLSVLVVNYLVQRKIKDRILTMVDVCRDYVGGDRSVRAVVNGDDDFAMLAMSLNTLLDNQGSAASATLGGAGSDAAALQAQIEKLLQEVSAVGDGDLRVQAEVTPDTLGVLADSFNYMIEELAKVVGRVQSTAVQVTNATRRILDRSGDLAQASEAQVVQISQTTEAVEALAIFIQNVARNAQSSVEAAQDALQNAAQGQKSVRQTIEGMMLIRENVQETAKKIKRLGERSNEIGEIIRIIEDIADQTNLLALNAAIQSAMAGEHGRGFAVVADEIRLLAERSTESTKRIATLIKSIQGDTYEAVVAMEDSTQEVVKGSQLADEAGRALNSIFDAVERQAKMIETIARAANEQSTVSEGVAVAMSRILELTRQTDAGTQEATVSVSYLADLSEQLRASVSTFRLPDRVSEAASGFSVTELSDGNLNQNFGQPLLSGMDEDWGGQGYSGNFPPLPEPGNTGAMVALASRSGQYAYNNQPDFAQGFGNGQNSFPGLQPSFPGQSNYNSQPGMGMPPSFSGQQDFGMDNFDSPQQQNMGGNNFNSMPGFNPHQGQSFYSEQQFYQAPNQVPPSPSAQTSLPGVMPSPQQQGSPMTARQRWQGGNQQNQLSFNQDQMPFQNNG